MAPQPRPKRKSDADDHDGADDSNTGFVTATTEDTNKRVKKTINAKSTSPNGAAVAGPPPFRIDSDGNQYWEISKMRRVTISEFRGSNMVNIREYYEKDGKDLPGKKGISMSIDQYSALVQLMPEIEEVLGRKGERNIGRPDYVVPENRPKIGRQAEEKQDEGLEDEGTKAQSMSKKSNIEATSDEDEGD